LLRLTGPGTHADSYTMCIGSIPGVKRPGGSVDHHPHLPLRLKKKNRAIVYSPSGCSCPDLRWNLRLQFYG